MPVSCFKACQTLGVSQLDSVIIAPPGPLEGDSQTLANLQPAWEELEALVRNQQIAAIGTSDLDKDLLEQLYNWADVSVWRPLTCASNGRTEEKGPAEEQRGAMRGLPRKVESRLQWGLFYPERSQTRRHCADLRVRVNIRLIS